MPNFATVILLVQNKMLLEKSFKEFRQLKRNDLFYFCKYILQAISKDDNVFVSVMAFMGCQKLSAENHSENMILE